MFSGEKKSCEDLPKDRCDHVDLKPQACKVGVLGNQCSVPSCLSSLQHTFSQEFIKLRNSEYCMDYLTKKVCAKSFPPFVCPALNHVYDVNNICRFYESYVENIKEKCENCKRLVAEKTATSSLTLGEINPKPTDLETEKRPKSGTKTEDPEKKTVSTDDDDIEIIDKPEPVVEPGLRMKCTHISLNTQICPEIGHCNNKGCQAAHSINSVLNIRYCMDYLRIGCSKLNCFPHYTPTQLQEAYILTLKETVLSCKKCSFNCKLFNPMDRRYRQDRICYKEYTVNCRRKSECNFIHFSEVQHLKMPPPCKTFALKESCPRRGMEKGVVHLTHQKYQNNLQGILKKNERRCSLCQEELKEEWRLFRENLEKFESPSRMETCSSRDPTSIPESLIAPTIKPSENTVTENDQKTRNVGDLNPGIKSLDSEELDPKADLNPVNKEADKTMNSPEMISQNCENVRENQQPATGELRPERKEPTKTIEQVENIKHTEKVQHPTLVIDYNIIGAVKTTSLTTGKSSPVPPAKAISSSKKEASSTAATKAIAPLTAKANVPSTDKTIAPPTDKVIVSSTDKTIAPPTDKVIVPSTDKTTEQQTAKVILPPTAKTITPPTAKTITPLTTKVIVPSTEKTTAPSMDKASASSTAKTIASSTDKAITPSTEKNTPHQTNALIPTEKKTVYITEKTTGKETPPITGKETPGASGNAAPPAIKKDIPLQTCNNTPLPSDKTLLTTSENHTSRITNANSSGTAKTTPQSSWTSNSPWLQSSSSSSSWTANSSSSSSWPSDSISSSWTANSQQSTGRVQAPPISRPFPPYSGHNLPQSTTKTTLNSYQGRVPGRQPENRPGSYQPYPNYDETRKRKVCPYYNSISKCKRGNHCPNYHDLSLKTCKYWKAGHCSYGARCKHKH